MAPLEPPPVDPLPVELPMVGAEIRPPVFCAGLEFCDAVFCALPGDIERLRIRLADASTLT
jgi:hypothetical protein